MELKFKVITDEGPFEFNGSLSPEEVRVLLEFAIVEMLRRGYMPLDEQKAARMVPTTDGSH